MITIRNASAMPGAPWQIAEQFAAEIALERTRLLYQGSRLPTLFMLLNGLASAYLLWKPQGNAALAAWLGWLMLLALLRLVQVNAFNNASPARQAQRT